MIFYLPVKQQLFHPDIGSYATYGIMAISILGRKRKTCFVSEFLSRSPKWPLSHCAVMSTDLSPHSLKMLLRTSSAIKMFVYLT